MFSKIAKFCLIMIAGVVALGAIDVANGWMGPSWGPKIRQDAFVIESERNIIEKVGRKIGGLDERNFIAAYAEYKISRQMAGNYHEQAISNFGTNKLSEILRRKRSVFFKCYSYDSPTRSSDFLGIKQGLFNRKRPDLFYDFLEACNQAWFAR
jgi:hypothetical protein